jgi:hypothetical protein
MTLHEFTDKEGVAHARVLEDGRVGFIYRLIFTCALCVVNLEHADDVMYEDRWCYHTEASALIALNNWTGVGEPAGWHRHPFSGRRRPDGDASKEYVQP